MTKKSGPSKSEIEKRIERLKRQYDKNLKTIKANKKSPLVEANKSIEQLLKELEKELKEIEE